MCILAWSMFLAISNVINTALLSHQSAVFFFFLAAVLCAAQVECVAVIVVSGSSNSTAECFGEHRLRG